MRTLPPRRDCDARSRTSHLAGRPAAGAPRPCGQEAGGPQRAAAEPHAPATPQNHHSASRARFRPGGLAQGAGHACTPSLSVGPSREPAMAGPGQNGSVGSRRPPCPSSATPTRVPAKETGTAVARGAGVTGNGAGRPRGGLAALVQLVGAELTRLAAVRLPRRRALGSPGAGAPRVPAGRGPLGRQGPASGVRPATRRSRRHIGRHSALLGVAAAGKPGLGPEPHTHQAPFHVRRAGPIAGFHCPLNPCFLLKMD